MKRGKDEEKIMGPMFPRLHVNDTEKGGPRAPPRNKMALYEQLSVPSQRFNPGGSPLNPTNPTNIVPPPSWSQGSGHERGIFYPLQLPHSMHLSAKPQSCYSELSTSRAQHEQKKKPDEDDFQVPIFVQSGIGQEGGRNYSQMEHKKLTSSNPARLEQSINLQYSRGREPKGTSTVGLNLRLESRSINEDNLKVPVAGQGHLVRPISNLSSGGRREGVLIQANGSSGCDPKIHRINSYSRLHKSGESLHGEYAAESFPGHSPCDNVVSNESIRGINNGNRVGDTQAADLTIPDDPIDDTESCDDRTRMHLSTGDVDKGDDASETSMVDSISGLDMSPDDVVGIIGQKHFWKARRAIANQQRMFAVQVFELHRLIKVQKLIAGSPHLLVEENAYLGKPLKGSPTTKLQLEYIVKAPQNDAKQKDDLEKPYKKVESIAENAVGKTSISSEQNGSQPPNYRPLSGNSPPTSMTADSKMGPLCFHQPPSHQWLIPVMSPSEGLVYKPYPGRGFMGPIYGGCGPPGSTPVMGNFFNPAYGFSASHQHYQGAGVPPFASPACHGYFPPYGMPVMTASISGSAVEQMNEISGSGLHGQLSGGGANNHQQPSSYNAPGPKDEATNNVMKLRASKDSELQVSTASSPSERGQGTGMSHATEARNALPLFPTSPAISIPDGASLPNDTDQPARVIRVVPHNSRSATASAVRIFQSIQRERKQYDSV